jgi:hypothetical protein
VVARVITELTGEKRGVIGEALTKARIPDGFVADRTVSDGHEPVIEVVGLAGNDAAVLIVAGLNGREVDLLGIEDGAAVVTGDQVHE